MMEAISDEPQMYKKRVVKVNTNLTLLDWKYSEPFISEWNINSSHIDHYQHTNNVAYLARQEALAWEHSTHLGLSFDDYEREDRAMAITHHELNYHMASHENDTLACATWIIACDEKFRLSRFFQFINVASNKTVYSATTQFVCIKLSNGMPKKMPPSFQSVYGNAALEYQLSNKEVT